MQVIWAGKPYPEDFGAIGIFNDIYWKTKDLPNCAILTGYEMELSGLLKRGSDLWLNTPKMFREASGTSGMTAAMNGSINLSIPDGWIPEFSKHGKNCFIISPAETEDSAEQDRIENDNLLSLLENEIVPLYYKSQNNGLLLSSKAWKMWCQLLTATGWRVSITRSCMLHLNRVKQNPNRQKSWK